MKRYLFLILLSYSALFSAPNEEALVVMTQEQFQAAAKEIAKEAADEAARKSAEENAQATAVNSAGLFSWSLIFNRYTLGGLGCACFAGLLWEKHRVVQAIKKGLVTARSYVGSAQTAVSEEEGAVAAGAARLAELERAQAAQQAGLVAASAAVDALSATLQKRTTGAFDNLAQVTAASHARHLTALGSHGKGFAAIFKRITGSDLPQQVADAATASEEAVDEFGETRGVALGQQHGVLAALLAQAQGDAAQLEALTAGAAQLQREIAVGGTEAGIDALRAQLAALTGGAQVLLDGGCAGASAARPVLTASDAAVMPGGVLMARVEAGAHSGSATAVQALLEA